MATPGSLMSFPIRTKDKGAQWSSRYDDRFQNYVEPVVVADLNAWNDSLPPTSSFDELFEDLIDSPTQRTHSSAISEIKLLTEPHPAFADPDEFWTKTLRALDDTAQRKTPLSETLQSTTKQTLDDRHHFDCFGFPSPPYIPDQVVYTEETRGRTRTGAQQGSIKRTRNPSGVRKSLRHTRSTPNMMSQSRYRPSLEEMLSQVQSNVPLVPMVEKKWHFRHPPSPPTSTETDDSFLPVRGLVFPMSNNETLARPAHLLDPLIVSDNLVHTPITSPLEDNYFPAVLEDHWANTYNNNSVSFNANTIDGPRSLNGRRYSYTENDVPTPPSFNPWTKANATSPAPLTFDAAMLRSVPTQAVMSAPALKPGQFGSGFPTDYTTQAILLGQALLPADVNVSPRTSTFPTGTPNFSLPYRSQRLGSPQRESRPPSILPAHQRATPKLPAQQGEDLNARRTRSSSRARTSKHHRRTKSGPEPTNEACSAGRPSRRRDGKSGHLAGFVNFTPDDSQKLLTGVAPSGSSKTKARREHEAREKRRRLSQAAVKAVREGDLGALREAGLVMEDV